MMELRRVPSLNLLFVVSVVLAGCEDTQSVGTAPPANEIGPYSVGVTTIEVVDLSREDRILPVEVWYPAVHEEKARKERYSVKVGALRIAQLDSPLGAVRDALPDESMGERPLIIFSHGGGSMRIQSASEMEYLASHGFIVVAPDHIGNTMADMLEGDTRESMSQSALDRPEDISFIIDQFTENLNEILPMLSGCINTNQIGVLGHSFGGSTAIVLAGATIDLDAISDSCVHEPDQWVCGVLEKTSPDQHTISYHDLRIKAVVSLAPGDSLFGPSSMSHVTVPTLIQAGDVDETNPLDEEPRPIYDGISEVPAWLAVIEGAGHFTFSDMCLLADVLGESSLQLLGLDEVFSDGCGENNIDYEDAGGMISTLTTAFFQIHLQGHQNASEHLRSREALDIRSKGH